MNTSDFLTLFGVIVAAIAAILTYRQWLKSHQVDQSHLAVSCVFKSESYGGIGFIIVFKNTGRYPAFVERISLKLKSGKEIPFVGHRGFTIGEPIKVTDEKPEELLFALYTFMKEIKTPLNINMIEVRDTHGKKYRYPARWPWSRSKFRKQIEQEWSYEQREYWESHLKEA